MFCSLDVCEAYGPVLFWPLPYSGLAWCFLMMQFRFCAWLMWSPAKLLHCQITVFSFVINKDLMGIDFEGMLISCYSANFHSFRLPNNDFLIPSSLLYLASCCKRECLPPYDLFTWVFISGELMDCYFIQWVVILCFCYLFWCSHCPRLGQWETLSVGSYVFLTHP